jgi:hypothetical protein
LTKVFQKISKAKHKLPQVAKATSKTSKQPAKQKQSASNQQSKDDDS